MHRDRSDGISIFSVLSFYFFTFFFNRQHSCIVFLCIIATRATRIYRSYELKHINWPFYEAASATVFRVIYSREMPRFLMYRPRTGASLFRAPCNLSIRRVPGSDPRWRFHNFLGTLLPRKVRFRRDYTCTHALSLPGGFYFNCIVVSYVGIAFFWINFKLCIMKINSDRILFFFKKPGGIFLFFKQFFNILFLKIRISLRIFILQIAFFTWGISESIYDLIISRAFFSIALKKLGCYKGILTFNT